MQDDIFEKTVENISDKSCIDSTILKKSILTAISYAESYQRLPPETYAEQILGEKTKIAVAKLAGYLYETRCGSPQEAIKKEFPLNEINELLRSDRSWNI